VAIFPTKSFFKKPDCKSKLLQHLQILMKYIQFTFRLFNRLTQTGLTRSTKRKACFLHTQTTSTSTKSSSYSPSATTQPRPTFWVTGSCDNGQMGAGEYLQLHSQPVKHDVLKKMNMMSIVVGLNHAMGINGEQFA